MSTLSKSFYLFDTVTSEVVYCTPTKRLNVYTIVLQGSTKRTITGTPEQVKRLLSVRYKAIV